MKHIEARSARRPKLEAPGVVLDRGIRAGPPGSFLGIATSSSAMFFCARRLHCFTLKTRSILLTDWRQLVVAEVPAIEPLGATSTRTSDIGDYQPEHGGKGRQPTGAKLTLRVGSPATHQTARKAGSERLRYNAHKIPARRSNVPRRQRRRRRRRTTTARRGCNASPSSGHGVPAGHPIRATPSKTSQPKEHNP